MFCPNCGAKCEDDALFCEECGTSLAEAAREIAAEQSAQAEEVQEQSGFNVQFAGGGTDVQNVSENTQVLEAENEEAAQDAGTQAENNAAQESAQQPMWNTQFGSQPDQTQNQQVYSQPDQTQNQQVYSQPNPAQNQQMYGQPNPAQGQQMYGGQPNMQPQPRKPFKIPKAVIAVAAAAVAVIIAIVVFVSVGLNATNYKKTAEKFVKAYVSGDYEKAYGYINMPESEFLTVDAFKEAHADLKSMNISEIEATDSYTSDKSSLVKSVNIKFTYKSGGSDYAYLDMEKTDSNYLLFFKKYKVSSEDIVAKDVVVKVPAGMKLTINGIEVTDRYLSEDSSKSYTYYKIPYLFCGSAKIKVTGDNVEDYEEDMTISYDEQSCYVSYSDMKVKESAVNTVKEQAVKDLEKLAAAGVAKKDVSELSDLIAPSYKSDVESDYRYDVTNAFHSSSKDISAISLNNVKAEVNSTKYSINSNGHQYIKVSLSYSMTGQYAYRSSSSTTRDGKGSTSSASITYVYENGKWLISAMSLYFSIY